MQCLQTNNSFYPQPFAWHLPPYQDLHYRMWPEMISFFFFIFLFSFTSGRKSTIICCHSTAREVRPSFSLDFGWTHTHTIAHTHTIPANLSCPPVSLLFNSTTSDLNIIFSLRAHRHVAVCDFCSCKLIYETNCPLCRCGLNKAGQSHLKSQGLIENLLNWTLVILLLLQYKWVCFCYFPCECNCIIFSHIGLFWGHLQVHVCKYLICIWELCKSCSDG